MQETEKGLAGWHEVRAAMARAAETCERAPDEISLVCVSKTHPAEAILPVLAAGQKIFGENRVQEAQSKWPELKKSYPDIELHLIGPLQTNKVDAAVDLFDVIETLDRPKLAQALADCFQKTSRRPRVLVQVNTGAEPQKAGILPQDLDDFLKLCADLGLLIEGLMCIPPVDAQASPHFAMLAQMARKYGLKILSMGMSADFELAIQLGATHVRVGSAIFGARPKA